MTKIPNEIFLATAVLPNGDFKYSYGMSEDGARNLLEEQLSEVIVEIQIFQYEKRSKVDE